VDFLDVRFQGQDVIATIQNVIGVIEGAEEPDRYARHPPFIILHSVGQKIRL